MSQSSIQWPRLLLEGSVIVVSILLAFAIDAWWEERQQAEEADLQVERVVTELEANTVLLKTQVERLDETIVAGKFFLSMFDPEPEPVEKATVGALFNNLYASGTIVLNRSASRDFLASGLLTEGGWRTVRGELAALLSQQDISEKVSVELRELRPDIDNYVGRTMPMLDTAIGHPLMEEYPRSRFPYDPTVLFSDLYLESQIGNFAIRMEINRANHQTLLEAHRALIKKINAARSY